MRSERYGPKLLFRENKEEMNEKKYLVYVDILGFEKLAEILEEERGIESREVREKFIDVINERVKTIEREGRIIGKKYEESDDWLLLTDSLENAFKCILEILDHHTPYKGYEKIPLEIAIGTGDYDKWARFDGKELIIENSTIKFIKTKIIDYYHDWYKQNHKNESPKSTFITLTESAYLELEPLDRKLCQKIEHKYKNDDEKEEVITFFAADVDRVQQRGSVFEFLEKIEAGSKWYVRIDEVYVPPLEYEDMARTLKEKRIVFITGTPEHGKTFTAIRLMWEFYNSGYEPGWIKGGELTERIEVRRKLEDIRAELKPRHIIYFEDPFGKTKYEQREGLEREIGSIIDIVKQVEDAYVIITSREEVFKEFEKGKGLGKVLKEFERKLNVKKPSYNYEKRKEILLNWAEAENCKWVVNEELKELVLESIEDEKILPTPLSIKDFAVATFDIEKEEELREKIKEKSKETAKAFAEEIKNMTKDKILFLSFLSIYDSLSLEFIRTTYQELVDELDLKDAWVFDRVLNWFRDDKINIDGEDIRFSHPSYSEALKNLLVEDGYFTTINKEIFSKLMLKLAEKRGHTIFFLMAVADNFYELPVDVKTNILLDLLEKDAAAWAVARVVANKPDTLPEDVTAWLFKLSEYDEAVWEVARAVADNFDKFPDDARNKLLLNLSKKDVAVWAVLFAVVYNLDTFPDDVRNKLLLNLSENDVAVWWPNEKAIVYNFGKLPENVKNALDGLPEPLQQVIGFNVGIIKNIETTERIIKNIEANGGITKFIEASSRIKERLQTICLKANTLSQLYQNFVFKIVNKK